MNNRDILDELRVRGELVERLKRIAPRFREIINLRYGLSFETGLIVRGEMTLEQVAQLYSITTERLRQIERRVFKELSEGLTDSPWHTDTPTEEGLYVVLTKVSTDGVSSSEGTYILDYWDGYSFKYLERRAMISALTEPDKYSWVAWQKITPFEEMQKRFDTSQNQSSVQ